MKSLKLRFVLLCISTVLTLCLSYGIAYAGGGCADRLAGGNAYGNFDCTYTGYCGGWCYYICSCSGVFPGYSCDDVLTEAGFEIVESPGCYN
jgi:hypothetical protein